jgi:hypothetical protein
MRTIHKYEISEDTGKVRMPRNADILCVQVQRGVPCVWAVVDDYLVTEQRQFHVVGTGHEMPDGVGRSEYIGTWQETHDYDHLVWHLFAEKGAA